jgi:hypothetical protein
MICLELSCIYYTVYLYFARSTKRDSQGHFSGSPKDWSAKRSVCIAPRNGERVRLRGFKQKERRKVEPYAHDLHPSNIDLSGVGYLPLYIDERRVLVGRGEGGIAYQGKG